MLSFDFRLPTRIVFGAGRLEELGPLAAGLDATRVLVVSDPGIIAAGHTQRGVESLRQAGRQVELFDQVQENPNTDHVIAGVACAEQFRPELIVGLGGGSSMDCAKGINFVHSCGGQMQDYWGEGKATGPMLPMIAVPTTAGTGSEAQSFALISDASTHVKMACGDKRAAFRIALLDPELTVTQPASVTALTGIDAIAHAVETCVTRRRSALSMAFSREAWRHLANNYPRVLSEPDNLEARAEMQLGACLAGLAIENSMLGAAHALANPLTAGLGIPHGHAVALMLPHVVRYNGEQVGAWYGELAFEAGDRDVPPGAGGAEVLADHLARLASDAGLASKLSKCGVPEDRLPELAAAAATQWTVRFNPREMGEAELLSLYQQAW